MLQWFSSAQLVEALTLSNFWEQGSCRVPYVHKFGGNAVLPSTVAQGPGLLDFLQPCCSSPIVKPLGVGLWRNWSELQLLC